VSNEIQTEPAHTVADTSISARIPDPRGGADTLDEERRRAVAMERLFGAASEPVRIGRFEVLELLGEGAMGRVYLARDEELDRRVALKRIRSDAIDHDHARHQARLLREARAVAALSHPNVIEVYDAGLAKDGSVYIAMEYVEGRTLRDWMKASSGDWRRSLAVHIQAGEGLAAAHAMGIVHRDFKPDNVMVGNDGRVRVLDFGLAIPTTRETGSGVMTLDRLSPATLDSGNAEALALPSTHSRGAAGTPAYMPPEQLIDEGVGPASDQFAFCVSLYEALFGVRPFESAGLAVRLGRIVEGQLTRPVSGRDVPTRVRKVVVRGLAAEPADRHCSMEDLLQALRRCLAPTRRATAWWSAAAVLGFACAAYAAWPDSTAPCDTGADRFDAVWTEARRAQIRAAFERSSLAYASEAGNRVSAKIDEVRASWIDGHAEVCRASHVDGARAPELLDRSMHCLNLVLAELDVLIDLLADADDADDALARRGPLVVGALPSVDRCIDLAERSFGSMRSSDPALEARIDGVRLALARVSAERIAGKHRAALTRLERLVEEAEGLDAPPLLAELALVRANLLQDLDHVDAAVKAYEAAFLRAGAAEDDKLALQAASHVLGLEAGRGDVTAARRWERHARARLDRVPPSAAARTTYLSGLAALRRAEDRRDESIVLQRENVALREVLHGERSGAVAEALSSLANTLIEVDRHDEALEAHHRIKAIFVDILGTDHPNIADCDVNIGVALGALGRHEEASERYRSALEIYERVLGPEHPRVALTLANLANRLAAGGQQREALELLERAARLSSTPELSEHPIRATILENLAASLREAGRLPEALDVSTRGLALLERTVGSRHVDAGRAHLRRALILTELERLEEALAEERLAAEIFVEALGPDHSLVSFARVNAGWTLVGLGHPEEAIVEIREGLRIRERALGSEHPDLVYATWRLGAAHIEADQLDLGRASLERALDLAQRSSSMTHRLEVQFDLARALWSSKPDRARSITLAEEALAGQRADPTSRAHDIEAIETWLQTHR
jgi:eukaryotic-like serine/threonine-protein kinase